MDIRDIDLNLLRLFDAVYRFGNVESGYSYLPDEMVDPRVNFETTKRVQIQYRVRVVQNVGLAQYPEGFDPTLRPIGGGIKDLAC